jgi:hypothetical protein
MEVMIGLGALLAALVPLWATWMTVRARSEYDYTRALEQRLKDAEKRLEACEQVGKEMVETIAELRSENLDLMRRLVRT